MRSLLIRTAVSLTLFGATAAEAQTPELVRDINQTGDPAPGTDPADLTASLGALFYVGEDSANGPDLRRMDGSGAVTFLLDSTDDDEPTELTPSAASLFFVVGDALYRTDGTSAGTLRVRRFPSDSLHSLTDVNGLVFFTRFVGGPQELWRSDGTDAGTISLAAANPARLTAAGNRLFFFRDTPATGRELWSSDGTVAGTQMVADVCPGSCSGVAVDDEFEAVGATVFFVGDDGIHGWELWRSDGTAAGTAMVKDGVPGAKGLEPRNLSAFGSSLLFTSSAPPYGLWFSDGTSVGTRLLRADLNVVSTIHDAGGVAFFGAIDQSGTNSEHGLWKTDGTPAGTRPVTSGCPGGCSSIDWFGTLPGVTVFSLYAPEGNELWHTDGTTAGTVPISPVGAQGPLTRFGNALYYAGFEQTNGFELWRTDGTAGGTVRVANRVEASSFPRLLSNLGERMFFSAERPDIGRELWSTTGTSVSTSFLDLSPGVQSSFFESTIVLGGHLVFGLYNGSGSLWKTDGTPAGTLALKPDLGTYSRFALGDEVVVLAGGGPNGGNVEPWRTDGTPGGTFPVADLAPGPASSSPSLLASFRDGVVFVAGGLDYTVWSSDGTPAGMNVVTSRPCFALTPVDDKLFMACGDAVTGQDVWVTDGTEGGTRLVRDIGTGYVDELVAVEGTLFFKDESGSLWRSDGTEAGTRKVEELVGFPIGTSVRELTAVGGVLFFVGHTANAGYELWRTDGTPSGTLMLRDIWPGPDSGVSPGRGIVAAGGRVVFTGYTPASGFEPWQSDGTAAGTIPLPEIVQGPASSAPYDFGYAAGRVYFTANDNVTGYELWTAPMPPGAVSVGDAVLLEGDTGASNAVFLVRLESPAAAALTVGYATVGGTAQAGTDFTPRSGVLTFQPGATSAAVSVPVLGDLQDEADETFTLELSSGGPVTFADRRGLGLVLDDDGPTVVIANAAVTEGNVGTTGAPFAVTLSTRDGNPTPKVKTVGFATLPVTATSGVDYIASSGTITFAAGTPSGATVTPQIAVIGDTVDEPDETFQVRLTSTSDAAVPLIPAVGLIRDDDGIASAPAVELAHGSMVRATLQPPAGRTMDRDWYALRQQARASYELIVDETSGDAVPLQVDRIAADGSTVLQSATAGGTGASVSLRWENTGAVAVTDQPVRIASAACGSTCGADDAYRVRFYETTLSVPRVNNSGNQVTVTMIQNATATAVSGHVRFWTTAGAASVEVPFQLAGRQLLLRNTGAVYPNGTGSLTVTHDGPYGALVGKAVALEPSTGFSFDTPMTYRPR